MAQDPRTQRRLATTTLRLATARREYAHRRDKYTRALIRWEARVQRLEAELEALIDLAEAPETGVRAAPLGRTNGSGRPTRSNHPFPRRVGNVAAWCEKHSISRHIVKSWYAIGPSGAPIPEKWALLIRREYGVKLSSWPNGVKR